MISVFSFRLDRAVRSQFVFSTRRARRRSPSTAFWNLWNWNYSGPGQGTSTTHGHWIYLMSNGCHAAVEGAWWCWKTTPQPLGVVATSEALKPNNDTTTPWLRQEHHNITRSPACCRRYLWPRSTSRRHWGDYLENLENWIFAW